MGYIFYVGINKYIGKKLSQLFYMKMKICFDPCFIDIRVTMARKWRHEITITPFLLLAFVFLGSGSFFAEIAEGSLYIGGGCT